MLFYGLTLALVLGVLEAGARILMPAAEPLPAPPADWAKIPEEQWIEYHPRLGWFHQKSKQASLVKNNLKIPLSTNSRGLRGKREYPPFEISGKKRIYAVGDSFTFGFGVRDEETFAARMETLQPSLDVLNLGVAGYGVDQMALLVEDFGFACKPAVTFIAVYPEDFWRATRSFTDAGYGKPYFTLEAGGLKLHQVPVPPPRHYQGSQFFDLNPGRPFFLKLLDHSALVRLSGKLSGRVLKKAGLEDPESGREWVLGREILKRLFETVRQNGSEPVLVIVPPMRWITGTVEPVRDSMLRLAGKSQVRAVDLTPVFKEGLTRKPIEAWYIPDDLHWTAEGHDLVARTLLEFLKSHG